MTRSKNKNRSRSKYDKADIEYIIYERKSKCNWKRDMIKFYDILFTPKYKKKTMNRWCSYGYISSYESEDGKYMPIYGWKSIPYDNEKGYISPNIEKTREEYRTWSWYIGSVPNLKGMQRKRYYFFS